MLDHEKLDVYQCLIEFLALAFEIIENIPRGHLSITNHLKRASISIPFNIEIPSRLPRVARHCGQVAGRFMTKAKVY